MSQTLLEYAEWLDERKLIWPEAPAPVLPKATPFLKPLGGIRAVAWSVYGTLLGITGGKLLLKHPDPLRMQVALEKTIQEFNMWNSMSRKPGQPWEYMLQLYLRAFDELQMKPSPRKGEEREVNAAEIWKSIVEKLLQKEYKWDEDQYGDIDDYSEKIAFFFQSCLQGVAAAPHAFEALTMVYGDGFIQGLIANTQSYTMTQLIRCLRSQSHGLPVASGNFFIRTCVTESYRHDVRMPSSWLADYGLEQFKREGCAASEVLYIGCRVHEELAPAKKLGMRTALYAGDKNSLSATSADMKDEAVRPDRILTDLAQLRQILVPDPEEEQTPPAAKRG